MLTLYNYLFGDRRVTSEEEYTQKETPMFLVFQLI